MCCFYVSLMPSFRIYLKHFSLYQTTKVFLAFIFFLLYWTYWLTVDTFLTSLKSAPFHINWLANFWRLLLTLQTSGKTSTDEWGPSAEEWRRVRDQCRRVKTSHRQMRDEYKRVKTNGRRVQTSADKWETSAILSFMNPKSPTVLISKRTCNVSNNQLNNE